MTAQEKEILMKFFVFRQTALEDEYKDGLHRLQYRRSDTLDCVEFMIARERLAAFNEFAHDVMHLLHLMEKERKSND